MNSIVEPSYTYFANQSNPREFPSVKTRAEPTQALARLIAIVRGIAPNQPAPQIVRQRDGDYTISGSAVLTLQGADGDPEMEWDDVAHQWATHPDGQPALNGYELNQILALLDEFRALVGALPSGESIYCRQTRLATVRLLRGCRRPQRKMRGEAR
ncbi:MAG: hypothetical protein HOQ05_03905 [Corynebacteriales bacterium]|nr:hypothetical protein [Mycobacteriales bacterium]